MGELKILAVEARNHLYNVLKDTEIWQEALESEYTLSTDTTCRLLAPGWKESRLAKEARRASRDQAMADKKGEWRT